MSASDAGRTFVGFADSYRFGHLYIKYEKFIMERNQGGSSRDLGAKKVIESVRASLRC